MFPIYLQLIFVIFYSKMAGATGYRYNFQRGNEFSESHYVDRSMSMGSNNEETQQYRLIIENLQQRIAKLENINSDLEARLELQAKQEMDLQAEFLRSEGRWQAKCDQLIQEINFWKNECTNEKKKNDSLHILLSRKEKEFHAILNRKYEFMRSGQSNTITGVTGSSKPTPKQPELKKPDPNASDPDLLQFFKVLLIYLYITNKH